jgi:hypothetical protein
VEVGQTITFTIVVGNLGPGTASGVWLEDNIQDEAYCSPDMADQVIGTLAEGDGLVFDFQVTANLEGTCDNTATLHWDPSAAVSDSMSVPIAPAPGAPVAMMGQMQLVNALETPTPTAEPATPTVAETAVATATPEADTPTAIQPAADTPTSSEPSGDAPTSTLAVLDTGTPAGPAPDTATPVEVASDTPAGFEPGAATSTLTAPTVEPASETPIAAEFVGPTQEPPPTDAPVETPSGGEATPEGAAAAGAISGGTPPSAGLAIPLAWLGLILALWLRNSAISPGGSARGAASKKPEAG